MKKKNLKKCLNQDVMIDGDLCIFITYLSDFKAKHEADGFFDISIEGDYDYGGDRHFNISIYGYRMETDEEFDKRSVTTKARSKAAKKATKTKAANKEKRELAAYKRLQKKYGNQ